ncbi:MAG: hypothetical protein JNL85_01925 [Rubrivivax sp.]|nr:hypothetical protein [Rubrivivax sp.]
MAKFLLLIAIVAGLALWLLKGRKRVEPPRAPGAGRDTGATAMVACAHCGVHLPRPDASYDAEGLPYCGEPHRVAGPRRP